MQNNANQKRKLFDLFMEKKKISPLYRFIKWCVRVCYPKMEVVGAENLPDEPTLIISNHAQMNGPIACELYFPGRRYTWCIGHMMHLKEVPAYAFEDFWSKKPRYIRWFYKLLSYIIAPLSVCIFNNADTIAVYKDTRIISTFRDTVNALSDGASVVIFPEHESEYNHIINDFQTRFVDIAKMYYRKSGRSLPFVPMYLAPSLRKMVIGRPIVINMDNPIEEERERICDYLKEEITRIALELPAHKVVPYSNIPKKNYPMSK